MLTDDFIGYIRGVRRYSERTCEIYSDVLARFSAYISGDGKCISDEELVKKLDPAIIRNYEMHLRDEQGLEARTVNLHFSAISSFCKYLLGKGILQSNPARHLKRMKESRRLPEICRHSALENYMKDTGWYASLEALEEYKNLKFSGQEGDSAGKMLHDFYTKRLSRLIISILHQTGIRRSELIGLQIGSVDLKRSALSVHGKGDKMREIPLTPSLSEEISLYLNAAETMAGRARTPDEPLLVTDNGRKLYPMYVDRVIKRELEETGGMTGRKSPHVLRHTLATELLDGGADIYSIKELLGHSSLAATQVYTHNSVEKLKNVYSNAHPRAKRGGKNGD
ncbi:MAG: tyrosine-type recombinase/integrase [Candidatus Cryptobacteroides sp.]